MPSELDCAADVVTLTAALVNWPSVSHHEADLADAVEAAFACYLAVREGKAAAPKPVPWPQPSARGATPSSP